MLKWNWLKASCSCGSVPAGQTCGPTGIHSPFPPALATALAIAVLGFGIFWFGPQKLFLNETAADTLPGEQGNGSPADVNTLSEGTFVSLAHDTTGTAKIVEVAGTTYLRFQNLDSLNGPDLVVYLSSQPVTADPSAFDDTLVLDLGALEANRGDLNIEIPAGSDLSEVKSAVIWCRRFTVAFGAADMALVP
ncbi:MAG: DM13 domain-containing protein [Actinomycetota bacterium]